MPAFMDILNAPTPAQRRRESQAKFEKERIAREKSLYDIDKMKRERSAEIERSQKMDQWSSLNDIDSAIQSIIQDPGSIKDTITSLDPAVASGVMTILQGGDYEGFLRQKESVEGRLVQEGLIKESSGRARVVSGDDPINDLYQLGIPSGESARVTFKQSGGKWVPQDVVGRFGSSTTVNVGGGESEFSKELGKLYAGQVSDLVKSGQQATMMKEDLSQMQALLSDPNMQTGSLQPLVTSLQGIAKDMGADLNKIAKIANISLGSLKDKQEFHRLATRVIIDGFEKFKGNLNVKEVQLAMDAFANLGRDEQANREAIASAMAAQDLAQDRARRATVVESQAEAKELMRSIAKEDTETFKSVRDKYLAEMQTGVPAAPPAALQYLKQHPETIDGFVSKYGYRPNGY